MKRFLLFLFLVPTLSMAQPITGLNFREWYNPEAEIAVAFDVVRLSNQIVIDFTINSRQFPLEKYSITWERRDTYTQRDGNAFAETPVGVVDSEKQKR